MNITESGRALRFVLGAAPLAVLSLLVADCGVVIGNTRPIDEKSEDYHVAELSDVKPGWEKIESKAVDDPSAADMTYQSKLTSSVISLNSACQDEKKPPIANTQEDLRTLSNSLFWGATEITQRTERNLVIQGVPALETTFRGRINNHPVMLQSVVLRHGTCAFTLIHVALPERFARDEPTFDYFVRSFWVPKRVGLVMPQRAYRGPEAGRDHPVGNTEQKDAEIDDA